MANFYIDNAELEKELIVFSESFNSEVKRVMKEQKLTRKLAQKQARGYISNELGTMFLKIAQNLINKNNFNKYTFKEEMMGLGIEYMCRFARTYDKTKVNCNGFSYCTQICYNGFLQAIAKEKKKISLKDKMIKESMLESEADKWYKREREFIHEDDNYR